MTVNEKHWSNMTCFDDGENSIYQKHVPVLPKDNSKENYRRFAKKATINL